ncbi:uncharacterized protein BJX67DRAFT_339773 [Aspergillus lucknowensis]|uniref:Uncharacterized protein n=1 Tax=Aspergillus lucknowensis TaxID=176173 RepID=A0ABR4M7F6_9EURO
MTRRGAISRPKRRTLVRWDGTSSCSFPRLLKCSSGFANASLTVAENLNELLLLTIQSVCNAQSIKIPWAEVARVMKHNTTEGAIVQHLAKLRTRRIGARKAVPPPLKRGSGGGSTKATEGPIDKAIADSRPGDYLTDNWDTFNEEWEEHESRAQRKAGLRQKKPQTYYTELPEFDGEESESSDGELLVPGAKFLVLPNDRRQLEASPSPERKLSKIVKLKCPKWYARLNKNPPQVPAMRTPTTSGCTFAAPYNDLREVDFDAYINYANTTETEMKYIPTGDSRIDLPLIGPMDASYGLGQFSDQFAFHEYIPPLHPSLESEQGLQDMLGENMNLDDWAWLGEIPNH